MKIKMLIALIYIFTVNTFASDIALSTLISNVNVAEGASEGFKREKSASTGVRIEPLVGLGEGKLTPAITFATNKSFANGKGQFHFGLKASATASLDKASEIANNFVLEGGDINFDIGVQYSPLENFGLSASYIYTLVSTNELAGEETTLEVESEVKTIQIKAIYAFNDVLLKWTFNNYDASNNGTNSQFNELLNGKSSNVFGVTLPFVQQDKEFFLKFERAKLSGAEEAVFRVAIETDF